MADAPTIADRMLLDSISGAYEPPAKRARLDSPQPPPSSAPSAACEPPSSSAYTIPTSSEQAVADTLRAVVPGTPESDDVEESDHDAASPAAGATKLPEEHRIEQQPPVQQAAEEREQAAAEPDRIGAGDSNSKQQADGAPSSPPQTLNSDFDDLDWAWLDRGEELEKPKAPPPAPSKGKGKEKASGPAMNGATRGPPARSGAPAGNKLITPASPAQVPQQVFFQTASNKKIAVSDNAIREALKRFEAWDAEEDVTTPTLGSGGSAFTPAAASAQAGSSRASLGGSDRPSASMQKVPAGPSRPAASVSYETPAPSRRHAPVSVHSPLPKAHQDTFATPSLAARRPLIATSAPAQPEATPRSIQSPLSPIKSAKAESLITPKPQPGTGLRRGTRPRFSTPFKKGVRPDGPTMGTDHTASPLKAPLTSRPLGPTVLSPARMYAPSAHAGPETLPQRTVAQPRRPAYKPVFDLSPPPEPRQGLAAAGYVPESVSAAQAEARGAPSEIFVILKHPDLARHYVFDDASMPSQSLGPAAALEMLKSAAGPSSAAHSEECLNLRWVQNHWSLILWKLAAMVRHKPEDVYWLWTWQEMCRQLRYRYEREVNRAERSAVKRIQEHDAPASSSLVLCVRSVLPGAPFWAQDAAGGNAGKGTAAQPTAYTLELTDGWYRIRASVDATLGRAIERRRIKAGLKLAIRGAKLHSASEGTAVLDALEKSGLSLMGNSTSLARWDARLGFSKVDFVASLRSLTADGGCVACMDVIMTKVHPRGYVDVQVGATASTSNARSEAEEREAVDRWQSVYEDARASVQADMEARAERWEEVKELVEEWTSRCGPLSGEPTAGVEEACDQLIPKLLLDGNPRQVLKAAAEEATSLPALIGRLRAKVKERAEQERDEAVFEAQRRLQEMCPPRRTRSFQLVRFRDANEEAGLKTSAKLKKSQRGVQLTVWDAAELNESMPLVEGGRYLISNLHPTLKPSWRGPDVPADIFLCTRRNTVWRRIS